ncbi:helix-turn-helix domain-containing protein [Halobacillus litoralis]|uniref:Helix-turn-helix domain-containing protein n=1 Tax=Halobacillus litoralis TaxID=45668 RepID=A0A845E807_9BACI|nr:helix-turn-helix domain-containing protein [Halobacillus litoralis]
MLHYDITIKSQIATKGGGELKQRKWLIELRKSGKMTQLQVANESGIERAYYTQIENGLRNPSVNVAKKISNTLGFDWAIFFEDECSEKRQKPKPI